MSHADQERWDARWARAEGPAGAPARILDAVGALPTSGRALELAAGAGRNSLWLARRGLDVTAVDISPVALARLDARAVAQGLAVRTEAHDLADGPPGAWEQQRWDLVLVTDYLQASLFPRLAAALAPGGLLLFSQPTPENLLRHPRPSRRFLIEPADAPALAAGLELLRCDAAWRGDGPDARHELWLVARRPG